MNYPFSEQLRSLSKRYLTVDMDTVTREQVSMDIDAIQKILDTTTVNDEFHIINGLVSTIISHLYVVRGLASTEIPRKLEYYSNMQECRKLFQRIIGALD